MDHSVSVRPADLSDVDAVAPLFDQYRQFYRQPPDLDLATAFLSARLAAGESAVFVAQHDGTTVGFVQCYYLFASVAAAPAWLLNDLFVAPEARGQGAGTALLHAAETAAARAGAAVIMLETQATNVSAQRLYERHGYTRDPGRLHYRKPLPAAT